MKTLNGQAHLFQESFVAIVSVSTAVIEVSVYILNIFPDLGIDKMLKVLINHVTA